MKERAGRNLRFALRVAWLLARGFTLILILLAGLAAGAFFALPRLIDNAKVQASLTARLEEILRRPVAISGVILTPQGIKLDRVRVQSREDPTQAMIESEFALVTFKLLGLLKGKLELGNVKLVAPRIRLTRDERGAWSFADIFASTTAVRSQGGPFSLPVSLAAQNTVIEGGELRIEDLYKKTSYLIEKFNLNVHEFDLGYPFTLSGSFDNISRFGGREVTASCSFEGVASLAGYDWPEAYFRAERLELDVDGQTLRGSGGVSGFPEAAFDADLQVPPLGPETWARYLSAPLAWSLPASRWKIKGSLPEPRRVEVESLRLTAPFLSLNASGSLDLSGPSPKLTAELRLEEFPLAAASSFLQRLDRYALKGTLQGRALLSGWRDSLALHQVEARLRSFEAEVAGQKVRGGDADLSASEDMERVSLSVSRGAVSAWSNEFKDIALRLSIAKKNMKVEEASARWEGARLRLKAGVLNLPDPKEVSIAGRLDALRWEQAQSLVGGILAYVSTRTASAQAPEEEAPRRPWVRTFKYVIPRRFPDTIGHILIDDVTHKNFAFKNAEVSWDIRGVTPSLKAVGGDLRVGFGPGRINDIQAVQDSHKFLKIVFLPYIYMHKMNNLSVLSAATAYPTSLDFNRIEGQYSMQKGVVTTRFFHVDSPPMIAYADGTADFGRERVDMSILTRLTSYRAPLPEWWVDEVGRPAIAFRVKGDLNQPELEPRLSKMASGEIEKAVEEARGRAKARFEAIERLKAL